MSDLCLNRAARTGSTDRAALLSQLRRACSAPTLSMTLLLALLAGPCAAHAADSTAVARSAEPGERAASAVPRLAVHQLSGVIDESLRTLIIRDDARGILQYGRDGRPVNGQDERGQGPLHIAIERESQNAFKALVQIPGMPFDAPNRLGETPLTLAAIKGDALAVDWLIRMGAKLDRPGWTPLHYAACTDRVDILERLLAAGAPVNAASENGTTPLMMAARYGSEAVLLRLLAAGAQRQAVNQRGMSAADAAEMAGRDSLAKRLRQGDLSIPAP